MFPEAFILFTPPLPCSLFFSEGNRPGEGGHGHDSLPEAAEESAGARAGEEEAAGAAGEERAAGQQERAGAGGASSPRRRPVVLASERPILVAGCQPLGAALLLGLRE